MQCENCLCEMLPIFGSGRFCSAKCARGFSTKAKRQEINEKVSKSLVGRKPSEEASTNRNSALREVKLKISKEHLYKIMSDPFDSLTRNSKRIRVMLEQDLKCLHCSLGDWFGKPIVLELDHVDGDNKNDERTNLRALCSNCHAQTPTWCGRVNGKMSEKHDRLLKYKEWLEEMKEMNPSEYKR